MIAVNFKNMDFILSMEAWSERVKKKTIPWPISYSHRYFYSRGDSAFSVTILYVILTK